MDRPEYSLSLDSVICHRCNTISRADEDTCPSCGADRQGAIFTSEADAAPARSRAAAMAEDDQLDFVDLRDTGWLTRMARRKMVTSYPSLPEPGDEPAEPARRPARTVLAVLISGAVAVLAAGGYLYTQSDGPGASAKDPAAISAAGAISDHASVVNDARRDDLTRARDDGAAAVAAMKGGRAKAAEKSVDASVAATVARGDGAASASAKPDAGMAVANGNRAANASAKQGSPTVIASVNRAADASTKPDAPTVVANANRAANASARQESPTVMTSANRVADASTKPDAPTVAANANRAANASAKQESPTVITSVNRAADVSAKPEAPTVVANANRAANASAKQESPTVIASANRAADASAKPEAPTVTANANRAANASAKPEVATLAASTNRAANASINPDAATGTANTNRTVNASAKPEAATLTANANRAANASAKQESATVFASANRTANAAAKPEAAANANRTANTSAKPEAATLAANATRTTNASAKPEPATVIANNTAKPNSPNPRIAAQTPAKAPPQQLATTEKPKLEDSPAIARSIVAVQQSLAVRDLASARRHMRALRASEPRSPEIQQLAADLSRQERARDAALANARVCTMNKEPSCAVRNARRAVSLDARNPQAQYALRHALAVQTDVNAQYFRDASALPAQAMPAMTFDGRWSVTAHRASSTTQPNDERTTFTLFGLGVPATARGRGDAH